MNRRFLLSFVWLSLPSFLLATNYYFSSTSTSSIEDGTQTNPYKTLGAFNFNTLVAGDNVYFKSGDVFRGQITLTVSGASGNPISFSTYGGAAKATISGADLLTTWTLTGGRYTAVSSATIKNFFVNNAEMTLARFPNSGYLTLDNGTTTSINDAGLTQAAGYWTGANVCVHSAQWAWEKSTVTNYTVGSLTYSAIRLTPIANYGYFLYNKLEECDAEGEWFFGSNTLHYKTTADPSVSGAICEGTVRDAGLQLGNSLLAVSNIVVSNLNFDKQYEAGIWFNNNGNQNITISDCGFYRAYKHGISTSGSNHSITNSYFEGCDASGISLNSSNTTVSYNTLRSIGQYRNSGIGGETNGSAIKVNFMASCHIHHNNIDGAGYCGISADGTNHIVERNIVKNCMQISNDGGGLKAFGASSSGTIFRNNIVSDTHGNTEGTDNGQFKTPAIYLDFGANNMTIQDNTVYNCSQKGIFLNGGTNTNTVTGNVVLGGEFGIDFNAASFPTLMRNQNVQNNVFFATTATAIMIRQSPTQAGDFNFGTINNNYYFHPYNSNRIGFRPANNYYTLTNWQGLSEGFDAQSKGSFVSWTYPTNYAELFSNPTDVATNTTLSGKYFDLDGNAVCGTITLQPYTARILINANTACTVPIALSKFLAKKNGKKVDLTWETLSEQENANFEIERSNDAKTWITIHTLKGNGNSSTQQQYQAIDENPLQGINYYRLRQTDFSGQATISKPISVVFDSEKWLVFPNPAHDILTIDFGKYPPQYACLSNSTGEIVKQINDLESIRYEWNIADLPNGVYFLTVRNTEGIHSERIIKMW